MSVKTGIDLEAAIDSVQMSLKNSGGDVYTDVILTELAKNVVRDISKHAPKVNRTALLIISHSLNVSISGLTGMKKILSLEYPVGYNPPLLRNWREHDDAVDLVEIDLDYVPTVTTGTLTGTVTFTQNDNHVTGVGTLFLTELSKDMWIAHSGTTKYYRVLEVDSNTSLYLEIPFAESTDEDTIDVTIYADQASVCYLKWGGEYTLATESSDMPSSFDEILVAGLTNRALAMMATGLINDVNIGEQAAYLYRKMVEMYDAAYQDLLISIERIEDDMVGWLSKGYG